MSGRLFVVFWCVYNQPRLSCSFKKCACACVCAQNQPSLSCSFKKCVCGGEGGGWDAFRQLAFFTDTKSRTFPVRSIGWPTLCSCYPALRRAWCEHLSWGTPLCTRRRQWPPSASVIVVSPRSSQSPWPASLGAKEVLMSVGGWFPFTPSPLADGPGACSGPASVADGGPCLGGWEAQ